MIFEKNINTWIYSNEIILQWIKDFEDVWLITFNNWILKIDAESKNDWEEIFNEFMNYLVSLINN